MLTSAVMCSEHIGGVLTSAVFCADLGGRVC